MKYLHPSDLAYHSRHEAGPHELQLEFESISGTIGNEAGGAQ